MMYFLYWLLGFLMGALVVIGILLLQFDNIVTDDPTDAEIIEMAEYYGEEK